jgi:cytochrome c oxidase subunit 2
MTLPVFFIPPQASAHAASVDHLIWSLAILVALLSAPVFILSAIYMLRFRYGRKADRSKAQRGSVWLETSWATVPFLLVMGFYVWSTELFFQQHSPPDDAMTINVVAKQWMWKFQHASGAREINELHVPVGKPVRLTMTSQDVIHSLYLPALRIKQDVLPGRYTQEWFQANKTGVFPLRCAEYCGTDHSVMGGRLIVQTPAEIARWQTEAGADKSLAERGRELFQRLGCAGCHGSNAQGGESPIRAPPLVGLYGRPVPLADGTFVKADDQYIHDSIMLPNKQIAAGYEPRMPPFGNVLDEEQVAQLEAYIRSLGGKEDR